MAAVNVQHLQCEMLKNPQGIGTTQPRLSWQINSDQRNTQQTAYQIIVASSAQKLASNIGDLWDSHKVISDRSIMINYAGKSLVSRAACYWKVKVWTTKGESSWSQPASWSIGLLNAADWKANWIGYEHGFPWDSVSKFSRLSARYYRKQFQASRQQVKKAVVYIVGLGHYELYINGKPIGDQVLAEAPTDYTQSVLYNTFDVTEDIQQGKNVIGTVLGNGRFFTMRPKYKPNKIKEFGFPKMLLQLEITYQDGSKKVITSDDGWKFTADGPIRTNNEYDGEEYDATKELTGWNVNGYDDSKWLKPELVESPGGRVEAQMNEPIKIVDTIHPISIKQLKPGTWIMDMGQNMAGWVQMKVQGKQGDKVTLRFAETLKEDSDLYVANLRDAKVTDVYTLKGGGEEIWHPVFVYHGFRYVQITGYAGTPTLNDFIGQAVSDNMANTGHFETSNPLINQIYHNAYWGILSDYKGMPVDCPQRNERMPWLGDRAIGSLGESFVFDNENLYAKWLDDIEQAQKPDGAIPDVAPAYWNYYSDNMTWPGTYILIADMLYNQFDDKGPIEKHYSSMKKWLGYMRQNYYKGNLMTKDKYGDWCVPPESPELIHSRDSSRNTNGVLIATAYYYRMLLLMQHFAQILNKPADVQQFAAQALQAKNAFNQKFLDKKTLQYDNNTVTANLLPLYFGMVPAADRRAVFNNIVNKITIDAKSHISTGVIGTQWLMRGLTDFGRPDIAYHIAANDDYPSWGYMVKRGATTIWELWNGDTAAPAMNSRNHIMLLGDLIAWFYQDLGGIKADEPGFKTIVMKPANVKELDYVNASYTTSYGLVKSNWKKQSGHFDWTVVIPANSKAIVHLPTDKMSDITCDGKSLSALTGAKQLPDADGRVKIEIESGDYHFEINNYGK
ncbi:glycoside hydrolase family 78 protein [Mucilaginibacter sp. X5P1]|uniref:glycoside hydrolase family 78 protein n=1 Tax=Mucilaginibacter sp. X5P1 TaxID=2723088 RepID=UPI00181954F8|nr:glycoside hydrolase family 78 protein [Mucilaginibacter sp. X5P1]MBB6138042.1 alpha-L-rhamnosidase [Mucilaginibacter sp. X5P1]